MKGNAWGPKAQRADTTALKRWVREEMDLPADTTVMVSELTCTEPGCPPLETVVSVFPEGRQPVLIKVAKPVAEVDRAALAAALAGGEHHH